MNRLKSWEKLFCFDGGSGSFSSGGNSGQRQLGWLERGLQGFGRSTLPPFAPLGLITIL